MFPWLRRIARLTVRRRCSSQRPTGWPIFRSGCAKPLELAFHGRQERERETTTIFFRKNDDGTMCFCSTDELELGVKISLWKSAPRRCRRIVGERAPTGTSEYWSSSRAAHILTSTIYGSASVSNRAKDGRNNVGLRHLVQGDMPARQAEPGGLMCLLRGLSKPGTSAPKSCPRPRARHRQEHRRQDDAGLGRHGSR